MQKKPTNPTKSISETIGDRFVRTLSGIVIVHTVDDENHLITAVADMWCDFVGALFGKGKHLKQHKPPDNYAGVPMMLARINCALIPWRTDAPAITCLQKYDRVFAMAKTWRATPDRHC